jgi:hypothetical protein
MIALAQPRSATCEKEKKAGLGPAFRFGAVQRERAPSPMKEGPPAQPTVNKSKHVNGQPSTKHAFCYLRSPFFLISRLYQPQIPQFYTPSFGKQVFFFLLLSPAYCNHVLLRIDG